MTKGVLKWLTAAAAIVIATGCGTTPAGLSAEKAAKPLPANQFEYEIYSDTIQITGYKGTSKTPVIPSTIKGKPVRRIAVDSFKDKGLTGVTIPEGIKEISDSAFEGNRLTSVILPSSLERIRDRAFFGNQLTDITIPNGIVQIGWKAFMNNQITSLVIPAKLKKIQTQAFAENQLTSLTIPASVKEIESGAFSGNPLTSVTLPADVVISASSDAFPFEIPRYYYKNQWQAGTYTVLDETILCNGEAIPEVATFIASGGTRVREIDGKSYVREINGKSHNYAPLAFEDIGRHDRMWYLQPGKHTLIVFYYALVSASSMDWLLSDDFTMAYTFAAGKTYELAATVKEDRQMVSFYIREIHN
jgi:hypothetical protein